MFWSMIRLALVAIRRNVLRSSLTVLGIVIGVAAVITMTTIGAGATAQGHRRHRQARHEPALVSGPARATAAAAARAPMRRRSSSPTPRRSRARCAGSRRSRRRRRSRCRRSPARRTGRRRSPAAPTAFLRRAQLGARVGPQLHRERGARRQRGVHPRRDGAPGALRQRRTRSAQRIRLGKLTCLVIGVLEAKGESSFGQDQDDIVLVPLRWLQRTLAGNTDVGAIFASARDGVSTTKVQDDLTLLLRERRHSPSRRGRLLDPRHEGDRDAR